MSLFKSEKLRTLLVNQITHVSANMFKSQTAQCLKKTLVLSSCQESLGYLLTPPPRPPPKKKKRYTGSSLFVMIESIQLTQLLLCPGY